jgi:O-antigen/teichoic acid export membrane protein
VSWRVLLRQGSVLGVAQLGNELVFASDVVLLRALIGREAAALYAVAQRVALAAETPVRVLGRLLQPHLLHAARHGDTPATLARAVRASAHLILPIAAGGWVVAETLLGQLFGGSYAAAGWTLRWLLATSVLLGAASVYGNLLVARGEIRAYLACLGLLFAGKLTLTLCWIGPHAAAGAAAASFLSMALASMLTLVMLRRRLAFALAGPWGRPLAHAALVALAAWLPAALLPGGGSVTLAVQLAGGGIAFALGLQAFAMRGRWRRLGDGLQRSSGFSGARLEVGR